MSDVLNILVSLSSCLGNDVVRDACQKFLSGKLDTAASKVKKERKPRGKSSWNLAVDKVLEEMRAASSEPDKVTYKIAYAEASRRKRENDPAAQAKYDTYREKLAEKRAAKKASKAAPAPAAPVEEEPKTPAPAPAPAEEEVKAPAKKKAGRPTKV
jgi:hypothetical protein